METNDEIRKFITENVAHSESLRHHKDQIIATVHENSAGVFRYAALVLDELHEPSPEPVSERLRSMPKGISGMYERILCRLCSQGGELEQKLRGRLLLWVAMAFQPVTIAVMQYACVTVDGHKAFDPEEVVLPTLELMLETCGSLLEVFDGDKLRFSHHTVKDFLLQPLENLSEDARRDERVTSCMVNEGNAHACMAMTCVTQLFSKHLHGLKHESEVDEGSVDKLLTNNSPFCYAISYWLGHAQAVPTGAEATPLSLALWQLVADFFWGNSGATFAEWRRVHPTVEIEDAFHKSPTGHKRCGAMIGLSWGPLHLAASYGLVDVLDWAHPEGIDFNVEVVFRSTPLWEATASGEESAVAVIVTKDGVDVNISNGLTPLIIAARDGHVGIVEILLRQVGIDVDKVSSNGYSALDLAIKGRNEEIVRLLLEHGAKREKSGRRDLTILGDFSSVKLSSSVGELNS